MSVLNPFGKIRDRLSADWPSQARKEQLPPPGEDWNIWILLAGRGFGKTLSGAQWVRSLAEAGRVSQIGLVAPTFADCRDTMIGNGLLKIAPNSFRPIWEPSKRRLVWPNGVEAWALSSEEPERLRGFNLDCAWSDELCAWRNVEDTWDMLQMCVRVGRPKQCITTTPKPIPLLKKLLKRDDVVVTRGKTIDNLKNLAPSVAQTILERYSGTRIGRQELDAEILDDNPGALWRRDQIEALRLPKDYPGAYQRIVVAIDPAVSVGEDSDETGIVVAGIDARKHAYVLQDLSGKFSPTEWASRAVKAYHLHAADRIVVETNMGGDLVENTLRVVDPNVPIRRVTARRGKLIRAEPASALYEQSRVHHVGMFSELEDQMCSFAPGSTDSPDRLDALVYALTELLVAGQRPQFVFSSIGPPDDLEVTRRRLLRGYAAGY